MRDDVGRQVLRRGPTYSPVDLGVLSVIAFLAVAGVLGLSQLQPYAAPTLDPRPALLPVYLLFSLARLFAAYVVAVLLALAVGQLAASSRFARRLILPVLDVLQSVPILGFFPVAVGFFIAISGGSALGVEAAPAFLFLILFFWNFPL